MQQGEQVAKLSDCDAKITKEDSKRKRIKPLQFLWGEKVIYTLGRLDGAEMKIPMMVGIVGVRDGIGKKRLCEVSRLEPG